MVKKIQKIMGRGPSALYCAMKYFYLGHTMARRRKHTTTEKVTMIFDIDFNDVIEYFISRLLHRKSDDDF